MAPHCFRYKRQIPNICFVTVQRVTCTSCIVVPNLLTSEHFTCGSKGLIGSKQKSIETKLVVVVCLFVCCFFWGWGWGGNIRTKLGSGPRLFFLRRGGGGGRRRVFWV